MKREAGLIAAGFAVAAVVAGLLSGVRGDAGLQGTLVVLPIVAALFALLAHRLGAPSPRPAELWLAAAWVALALGAGSLGIPGIERILAGGYLLLVAARAAALLPALRRWGSKTARSGLFALLPYTVGLACLPWTHAASPPDGDEPYYLLLSESLASDFDVDLANQYESGVAQRFASHPIETQPFDPVGPRGERYSRHSALLPLLLIPFWKVGGAFGARLALVACWALLAERLLRLMLAAGIAPRGAFRAWGIASFAMPLLPYSRTLWIEIPAALAATLALEAWLAIRAAPVRASRGSVAVLAVALAILPCLKLRLIAVVVPLGLVMAWRWPRHDRRRWLVLAVVAAVTLALLTVNVLLLDNPLGAREAGELYLQRAAPGHYVVAFAGLFFDVAFGLLPMAPIWLLALPGAVLLLRRDRAWCWAFLATLPYLVLVLRRSEWYGGWCPPFRYLVALTPWLALALGAALERPLPRSGRRLAGALLAISAAAAWAVTLEPAWAVSLADGRSRLLDLLASPFAVDFARFTPSAVRPRIATAIVSLVALAATFLFVRGRRRAARAPSSVAVAMLLASVALLVLAAHRLPTRIAELEDPWVKHEGGDLYPSRWTVDRTRFDGGWILPPGARLRLQPRAGGAHADLVLRWRTLPRPTGPSELLLLVDHELVRRWRVERGDSWRVDRVDRVAWAPGATVELRVVVGSRAPGAPAVVDRLEFQWN
jgi:hypothetical protein